MIKFNKKYKYADLCRALDVPRYRGSKQKTQLNNLGKKYEIEKTTTGYYIIKKEYSQVESIENITYHKNKSYIEPMMYTLLSNSPTNIIQFDMKQLMEILSLVNKNFFIAKWNIEKTDKAITGTDTNGLSLFLKETEPILRKIIKDVLSDMEDKQLITVQEIPKFAKKYKGENGKWYTKTYEINDETEYPTFMESKRLALKKVGVEKWSELNYYQHQDVKHYIEDYLKESFDISYYFYSYKIILNKKGLSEFMTENYMDFQKSFNQYIQNKIFESKRKNLLLIEDNNKEKYIDALINIETNFDLKKELKKVT